MSSDTKWRNFSHRELICSCGCKRMEMSPDFMQKIQDLRDDLGFPFPVLSAYRCSEHNAKISSTGPDGPHTTGHAIDIQVFGWRAWQLLQSALADEYQLGGIGVNQKGPQADRFIHLDDLGHPNRPSVWSY